MHINNAFVNIIYSLQRIQHLTFLKTITTCKNIDNKKTSIILSLVFAFNQLLILTIVVLHIFKIICLSQNCAISQASTGSCDLAALIVWKVPIALCYSKTS